MTLLPRLAVRTAEYHDAHNAGQKCQQRLPNGEDSGNRGIHKVEGDRSTSRVHATRQICPDMKYMPLRRFVSHYACGKAKSKPLKKLISRPLSPDNAMYGIARHI